MKALLKHFCILAAFLIGGSTAQAQLPNEKFGKPSSMEWEYTGWGDAINADAIILCKTMKVTYQLSDQLFNTNQAFNDVSLDNLMDFGKNDIEESNILVKYEVKLRTKILRPEGARHANIDITYFNADDSLSFYSDEVSDLSIKVFTKNEKGKVVKKTIKTDSYTKERLDGNYMVMHVVVPDIEAGSIIEYQYNITSTRPTFLYDWVFQERIPTVRSKCEYDIPALLQFNINAPINKLIKSSVEVGQLTYDNYRADMKKAKTCATNHYTIVGDYILPEGYGAVQGNDDNKGKEGAEKIAILTSKINMPNVTPPASLPSGHTHLCVK